MISRQALVGREGDFDKWDGNILIDTRLKNLNPQNPPALEARYFFPA
jgi:hypothetical protein